jgi:hypothetical protein
MQTEKLLSLSTYDEFNNEEIRLFVLWEFLFVSQEQQK